MFGTIQCYAAHRCMDYDTVLLKLGIPPFEEGGWHHISRKKTTYGDSDKILKITNHVIKMTCQNIS